MKNMTETNRLKLINTNSPRDSRVFADGDFVVKNPVATNVAHINVWIERQTHAKDVIDNLLNSKTDAKTNYFIPKIVEISKDPVTCVREERVPGKPITKEYFDTLSPIQQETIYKSLAEFASDMNQSSPILNITEQLGNIESIIEFLKSVLDKQELELIKHAYDLLKSNVAKTPSLVFFHGDMNENNIFFDETTNTVSVIDFTEARYESADYMFNSDLSRLPWLDIKRLIDKYNSLPKKNPVRVNQDKDMIDLFNALRTVQRTGESMLARPQNTAIFTKILKENIVNMEKVYQRAFAAYCLSNNGIDSR